MSYTKKKGGGLFKYLPWIMSRQSQSHPIRGESPPGTRRLGNEWGGNNYIKWLKNQQTNKEPSHPRKNSHSRNSHKKHSMKNYSTSPRRSSRLKSPRRSSRSAKKY